MKKKTGTKKSKSSPKINKKADFLERRKGFGSTDPRSHQLLDVWLLPIRRAHLIWSNCTVFLSRGLVFNMH